MTDIQGFKDSLIGCDVLFHTAAFFRDNYKGGDHWSELHQINVEGTRILLETAYQAGIRRVIHTSSIAVLNGELIDETMLRDEKNADNYYRSKILADQEVINFLNYYPDMFISMVLPGWMFGPRDIGPTSSGEFVLNFLEEKLPGVVPGSFSIVDARDVALIQIAALEYGRRGERYLAAGSHMTMAQFFPLMAKISGIKAPTKKIPWILLKGLSFLNEIYGRITKKQVLLSKATVKLMATEEDRTHFNHEKTLKELGITFRPIEETLTSVIEWYRKND